jgi:hypothetical protein
VRVKRTLDVHDETVTNDKEERACFSRGNQPRRSRFYGERQAHNEAGGGARAVDACESRAA